MLASDSIIIIAYDDDHDDDNGDDGSINNTILGIYMPFFCVFFQRGFTHVKRKVCTHIVMGCFSAQFFLLITLSTM